MLTNVELKKRIDTLAQEHCDELDVSAKRIFEEECCIAFFDIRESE
jgi:hypothetical protein